MSDEVKLILIFDDLGNMYEVENIREMLSVMEDDEILPIYKSTVYEHRLNLAMEELVDKGYLEPSGNKIYIPEAGQLGIDYLTEEITNRFGEENQKRILSEIDLTWEKNKPVIPDKRKKK